MKIDPPAGVPKMVRHGGKTFHFDVMSGTGEPVYVRKEGKDETVRRHVIYVRT